MLLFALSVITLTINPAVTDAKPGYSVYGGSHSAELTLKGSHGYHLQISETNRHRVEVFATKGDSTVVYAMRSTPVKGDAIRATLPGIGRISVHFRPAGPVKREPGFHPPQCRGGATTRQSGYFEGKIRIRGEQGYTEVQAKRVRGRVRTVTKEICPRSNFGGGSGQGPREEETRLSAVAQAGNRVTRFSALSLEIPASQAPPTITFFALLAERREGMAIARIASARGEPDDFSLADASAHPASATVTPPPPFQGSATFQKGAPAEGIWSGSLEVSLPGVGEVPLAGSTFEATLCRNSGCPSPR